ncbi:5634_t:CDS:2, partial [Racocetra persica]
EKFGWIPSEILNTLYTNDNEIIACVEQALHKEILFSNEDSVRMDRILVIFGSLDAKAKKGDNGTSEEVENLSNTLNQIVRRIAGQLEINMSHPLLLLWVSPNNICMRALKVFMVQFYLDKLPDPLKSTNHLSTFPQSHDTRLYKLIRDCMNPQSDYKTVRQSA